MRQYFYDEHASVMNRREKRNSFVQIVGEHAVRFIELAVADRCGDKRKLMSTAVNIARLNDEWLQLVCPMEHESNADFKRISGELIGNYADIIGDFILDSYSEQTQQKVHHIASIEGDFYAALVDDHKQRATRKQWIDYTHTIGHMVLALDKYGKESDIFHCNAANCIRAAKLLGVWLDAAI